MCMNIAFPDVGPLLCLSSACLCFSFCLWQDQFDVVCDADLQGLDAKILALTAKVQSLQQGCRHMEAGRTGSPWNVPLLSGLVPRSGITKCRIY